MVGNREKTPTTTTKALNNGINGTIPISISICFDFTELSYYCGINNKRNTHSLYGMHLEYLVGDLRGANGSIAFNL